MSGLEVLQQIWNAVAIHLWQTTLVIAALLLPYLFLRKGPAGPKNLLWSIALAKLLMPTVLLGRLWGLLAAHMVPILPGFLRGDLGSGLAGRVTYLLDPVGSGAIASGVFDPAGTAFYVTATSAWLLGAGWLVYRWAALGRGSDFKRGSPLQENSPWIRKRVLAALEGTCIDAGVIRIVRGPALPAVTGIIQRRIVVSEQMTLRLRGPELRAILLHEQEHRRRFDPLRAVAKRMALALFFYYPPLWAIVRQLDETCEQACDQAAVRAGAEPSTFARALARSLAMGLRPAPAAAGLGIKRRSSIRSRFEQIGQSRRLVTMKRHRLAMLGAVALAVTITAFPLPSCVKEDDTPQPPKPLAVAETPEPGQAPEPPAPPGVDFDESVTPPSLIQETVVLPEYPEAERNAGIEGTVLLQVEILKDGTVGEVSAVEGVEGHPAMAESAIAAMRGWKFQPAVKDGEPVDMTVQIPLAFKLDGHGKAKETDTGDAESMPQLIQESIVKPAYPEEAREAGVTGQVLLEVEVSANGTPARARVKQGIPGYPSFGDSAARAVMLWKFRPATRGGSPVSATVMIPVEFSLDEKPKGD